ncbi:MAG: glycosyltransferase family 4 protein [Bacteroidales bacterium]|nr:glycosyltransferase family 4 protein [Bacteroidales bacterium]
MKIVHVCITGIWGEQYAYQENLLPHYQRIMGNEVTIIASVYSKYKDGVPEKSAAGISFLQDGTKLVRLNPLVPIWKLDSHLHLTKGLWKAIVEEKPDLLFLHDLCTFSYRCLPKLKKALPKMHVVFDNHIDTVNSMHSFTTKFLHRFMYRHFLVPKLVRISDVIYGVTPSRCDFLHDVYGIPNEKIKLLMMGADDEKMKLGQKNEKRAEIRAKYGISDDDFLIVTGGKIDLQKNIHVLAKAVNEIADKNVKLLVFGSITKDLEGVFDSLKSENVLIIGWINSDKVYDYFYAADFVMFPGQHSVMWEQAVASKVPCAFTKIDGFEHVNINENCVLMTENTADYYKNLILSLCKKDEKYQRLKENADSEKTGCFLYSNIANKVLEDIQ